MNSTLLTPERIDRQALVEKYDRPGPRYTSYPTAPAWRADWGPAELAERLDALGAANERGEDRPLSLYIHIPFCEERCLFCGCNVVIARQKKVAIPYLEHLKKEMDLYVDRIGRGRHVLQLHLGGGTPTYLSPEQLTQLMAFVRERFDLDANAELSIEVDPMATTREHLETLRGLGFNRISMGLQDLDPNVQRTVKRIQPWNLMNEFYRDCRELAFESVNIDLIYGLPHQSVETFEGTLMEVTRWRPDRVAVFNYAHVPWLKKHQAQLPADKLPDPRTKLAILEKTREHFAHEGYVAVGLDHFALPGDELSKARRNESLRRNFMGYTTLPETELLGFGVSSISDVDGSYSQNYTKLAAYYRALDGGQLPAFRGVALSRDDLLRRDIIMGLMNNLALDVNTIETHYDIDFYESFADELVELQSLQRDGLVALKPGRLEVTPRGQLFVRNVAMAFDAYLKSAQKGRRGSTFSRTI